MLPVIKKGKKVMILIVSKEEMAELAARLSGRTYEKEIDIPVVIEVEKTPDIIDMRPVEAIETRANSHSHRQTKTYPKKHKSGITGILKKWKEDREYIRKFEKDDDTTLKVITRVIRKIATGDIYDMNEYPTDIPYDPVRDVIYLNGYKED